MALAALLQSGSPLDAATLGEAQGGRVPDLARALANPDFLLAALLAQRLRMPNESEVSITVEEGGKFFNIPSIDRITGRALSGPEAIKRARADGLLKPELGFSSEEDAVRVAVERSRQLGAPSGEPLPRLPNGQRSRGDLMMRGDIGVSAPQPEPGSILERMRGR